MDYAWGANGLDAIITQVFLKLCFLSDCINIVDTDANEMCLSIYPPF